jgi:peptidoglycan/LPS O-acetylase OafA/YrhL
MPNTRQRIISIQACRGIAAMLVVLVHLSNVERKDFPSHLTNIFQFGNLGVDLFFVISGVVISTVTVGKFSNSRSAGTFLKHRLFRIFPIYWFYCAIFLVGYLYNPLWFNNSTGHHVDIVKSFLLIPTNGGMLIMQGWTLSYEMYFYLVFFLILFFVSERLAPVFLSAWGAVIVAGAILFFSPASPIIGLTTSPMILEFLTGCLIFHVYHKATLHPRFGTVLVAISFLWLSLIVFWTFHAHGGSQLWIQDSRWGRPASYGVFAALFLLGLMELERSKIIRFGRPFEAVGDWSYSIYLSHVAIIEIVGRVTAHFAARISFSIFFVFAISLPLVLLLGYLSYNWIEKPLMTVLYKRTGKPGLSARSLVSVVPNS